MATIGIIRKSLNRTTNLLMKPLALGTLSAVIVKNSDSVGSYPTPSYRLFTTCTLWARTCLQSRL